MWKETGVRCSGKRNRSIWSMVNPACSISVAVSRLRWQPVAEGEVGGGLAGDVEPVRITEDGLVVVGRAVVQQDEVPGTDRDPADLQIGPRVPGDAAAARCPQHLLHHVGDQ